MKIYCFCKNCKKTIPYHHYRNERELRNDIGNTLQKAIACEYCGSQNNYDKTDAHCKVTPFRTMIIWTFIFIIPLGIAYSIFHSKISTMNLYNIMYIASACFGLIYSALFKLLYDKKKRVKDILRIDKIKNY